MSSGKGIIPYESIKKWEEQVTTFLKKPIFTALLKTQPFLLNNMKMSKNLMFNLMKMQTLSDLNALYNFQDTIIICEIFENRKFKFNSRKCSSASTLSGAIHRDMSKVIISFPTKIEIVELMEKTLIGGIIVVNTRIGFDTDLFIKNTNQKLNFIKIKIKTIKLKT